MKFNKKWIPNFILIITAVCLLLLWFSDQIFAMDSYMEGENHVESCEVIPVTEEVKTETESVTEVTEEIEKFNASSNAPNASPTHFNTQIEDGNNDLWMEAEEPEGEGTDEIWVDEVADELIDVVDELIDVVDEDVEVVDCVDDEEEEGEEVAADDSGEHDCPDHELIESDDGYLYCPYCGEIGIVCDYVDEAEEPEE